MKLPRGWCPDCGSTAAVRSNGVLRQHYIYLPQQQQDPTRPLGRVTVCPGSGKAPVRPPRSAAELGLQ